jgi:hypothetical protein
MHNEPFLAKCSLDAQTFNQRDSNLLLLGCLRTAWNRAQALGFCALLRGICLSS